MARLGVCAIALALGGCGAFGSGGGPASGPLTPADPTPLGRCKVAASASSPLVTEWPASEKAHLESLAAAGAVAVEYSGCELRLVDACKPPGRYAWRRTTLARDSVELTSADDLWAKLPLGAASLEGELGRTGRLAVRTTVSGQLALEGFDSARLTGDAACARATHVISAISVGAFELVSGGSASTSGGGSIAGVGAGARREQHEQVMRSAGSPDHCAESNDAAPDRECASPVQLFLQPLSGSAQPTATASDPAASAPPPASPAQGVEIVFPAPEDSDEHWSLHDANGTKLCALPCMRVVPIVSGYYLERASTSSNEVKRVELPNRLPLAPDTRAEASYRAERGSPFLSKLTFYGLGIPAAVGSLVTLGLGISESGSSDDNAHPALWYTASAFYGATAIGTYFWFAWSHDASLELSPAGGTASAAAGRAVAAPTLRVGPGFVTGTF